MKKKYYYTYDGHGKKGHGKKVNSKPGVQKEEMPDRCIPSDHNIRKRREIMI